MEIEIFTICDSAHAYNNKLVIVGTFNQITSNQYPMVYPSFTIVGRICYEYTERGQKTYELTILDPNGNNVVPQIKWDAEVNVEPEKNASVNFNINLNEIQLGKIGTYNINLKSEGINRTFKLFAVEKK